MSGSESKEAARACLPSAFLEKVQKDTFIGYHSLPAAATTVLSEGDWQSTTEVLILAWRKALALFVTVNYDPEQKTFQNNETVNHEDETADIDMEFEAELDRSRKYFKQPENVRLVLLATYSFTGNLSMNVVPVIVPGSDVVLCAFETGKKTILYQLSVKSFGLLDGQQTNEIQFESEEFKKNSHSVVQPQIAHAAYSSNSDIPMTVIKVKQFAVEKTLVGGAIILTSAGYMSFYMLKERTASKMLNNEMGTNFSTYIIHKIAVFRSGDNSAPGWRVLLLESFTGNNDASSGFRFRSIELNVKNQSLVMENQFVVGLNHFLKDEDDDPEAQVQLFISAVAFSKGIVGPSVDIYEMSIFTNTGHFLDFHILGNEIRLANKQLLMIELASNENARLIPRKRINSDFMDIPNEASLKRQRTTSGVKKVQSTNSIDSQQSTELRKSRVLPSQFGEGVFVHKNEEPGRPRYLAVGLKANKKSIFYDIKQSEVLYSFITESKKPNLYFMETNCFLITTQNKQYELFLRTVPAESFPLTLSVSDNQAAASVYLKTIPQKRNLTKGSVLKFAKRTTDIAYLPNNLRESSLSQVRTKVESEILDTEVSHQLICFKNGVLSKQNIMKKVESKIIPLDRALYLEKLFMAAVADIFSIDDGDTETVISMKKDLLFDLINEILKYGVKKVNDPQFDNDLSKLIIYSFENNKIYTIFLVLTMRSPSIGLDDMVVLLRMLLGLSKKTKALLGKKILSAMEIFSSETRISTSFLQCIFQCGPDVSDDQRCLNFCLIKLLSKFDPSCRTTSTGLGMEQQLAAKLRKLTGAHASTVQVLFAVIANLFASYHQAPSGAWERLTEEALEGNSIAFALPSYGCICSWLNIALDHQYANIENKLVKTTEFQQCLLTLKDCIDENLLVTDLCADLMAPLEAIIDEGKKIEQAKDRPHRKDYRQKEKAFRR